MNNSNFHVSEANPLNDDDIAEIELLKNQALRPLSRQQESIKENKISITKKIEISLQGKIFTLSSKFPHGSTSRIAFRRLARLFPLRIRNFVSLCLTPKLSSTSVNTTNNLDLGFGISSSPLPDISIVIPVYNNWWVTYRCLRAIQRSTNKCTFEVIVIDDGSSDYTSEALKNIRGIKVVTNMKNVGYLESTNRGASQSHVNAKYIALLNNDTEPIGSWLDELIAVFGDNSETAIVGSTLMFPDGQLQESGVQIFKDASGWNIGRGLQPSNEMFMTNRQVDYCSAASILVDKEFWERVKGFDARYKPAYYEDSDLAMRAWNLGFKVFVSYKSWVIHHEGVSHGTSLTSGTKKFQNVNKDKFAEKWNDELTNHWENQGFPRIENSRNSKGIIVLCDQQLPDMSRDSGSQRTIRIAQALTRLDYQVVLVAIDSSSRSIQIDKLRSEGIEVHTSLDSFYDAIGYRGQRIKFYWTIRDDVFNFFEHKLKEINPSVFFIADLLDLKFQDRKKQVISSSHLSVVKRADLTVLVSPLESKVLKENTDKNVMDIWYDFEDQKYEYKPLERSGILFVGGFRHRPNVEGIYWFAKEVLPIARSLGYGEEITVVGSGLSSDQVEELTKCGLRILGYQKDISIFYQKSRVAIVPLLNGAGLKGKLAEALSFRLPTITTSIGAEGFRENVDGDFPFVVSDDASDFASEIMRLCSSADLSTRYSVLAKDYVKANLGTDAFVSKVAEILDQASTARS
jgi:GT2 family glycosyltransferase